MSRTLASRGPDAEATWVDPGAGIALGHRRLAIIDLSPAGNQPMFSATGRYVIVFNGEIYNFLELRRELENSDNPPAFQGRSDTEVMLACFERWGVVSSVCRFNGMFAFAVWDRFERTIYMARDRIGEKPLYYACTPAALIFGSELKALREHPAFPETIDSSALALYLQHGFVPGPYSIYQGVFKLQPGSILRLRAGAPRPEVTSYWSVERVAQDGYTNRFSGSVEEAGLELESLLRDAIKIRMIADVGLGAFLSGGVDSSLITALMQSVSSKPVRSFTIGFSESSYNEAQAAKAVASHLGTDHTEWYVTPREAKMMVPRLPYLYDEPFADSSQIPTCLVATMARRHVTVTLSGDGADELFGGYTRYSRIQRLRKTLHHIPLPIRWQITRALKTLICDEHGAMSTVFSTVGLSSSRLGRLAALASTTDPEAFYHAHNAHWDPGATASDGQGLSSHEFPECDDYIHHMMGLDTLTYLPDDILVKVDRASMGVSLESRAPFLDHRVVEFAWRLPLGMKLERGNTKLILRRILYKHVPRSLVERPKTGFGMPVAEWIRRDMRDWAEELLSEKRLDRDGYIASKPVRRMWKEHLAGSWDHSPALWSVLMFQLWLETQSEEVRRCDFTAPVHAGADVTSGCGDVQ